jgi:hypothetical protein
MVVVVVVVVVVVDIVAVDVLEGGELVVVGSEEDGDRNV